MRSLWVVFFCVPLTLFWLLVLVKDHHLEVFHHLFDISGEEHMAIQRQSPVWHHRPQGKVGIVKTPDWDSEHYLTASIHLQQRYCPSNVLAWACAAGGCSGFLQQCVVSPAQTVEDFYRKASVSYQNMAWRTRKWTKVKSGCIVYCMMIMRQR